MCRSFFRGFAAVAVTALVVSPAFALRIAVMAPASTKTKVFQADCVIVGKVTGIESESVELEPFPGQPKVAYEVANIKIESAMVGAKNVTHLKVAFQKQEQPGGGFGGPGGPGRPIRPGVGFQQYTPEEKHEGLFFLQKHPTAENYYVVQMGHSPVLTSDPKYKGEVESVQAMVKAFADPVKALTAEKDEDRVANALSLAQKYRLGPTNNPSGVIEESPVPAEQTKLFLKVLSEVDWSKHPDAARTADALGLMPGNFGMPRVTPGDGEDPMTARQKAFKAWAELYGSKFEVKKVSAKPLTGDEGNGTGTITPVRPIIRR